MKQVDARGLKPLGQFVRAGSIPASGTIKNFTPSGFIINGNLTPISGPGTRWRGTRLQLEVSGSIPHRVSIFVDFLLKNDKIIIEMIKKGIKI